MAEVKCPDCGRPIAVGAPESEDVQQTRTIVKGVAFVVFVILVAALGGCWITSVHRGEADALKALDNGLIQRPVKNANGWVKWELVPK